MSELIKNIVLVGRTGNGKSATGNTLIGEKMFESKKQAVGVTMKCEIYRAAIQDGPIINVIDTPGLCDSAILFEDLSKEITNCLTMAEEGIHAVLLVLSLKNRVSQEEESTINTLQRIFDSKILDYFIIVFTGGDELEEDNQTLDDFFRAGCPEFLTKFLRLCDGRKVVFNNRTKDQKTKTDQLKQLLAHVADIGEKTGGIPYTYQMHSKIKEETEKHREQERAAEAKNLAEAELAASEEKIRIEKEMIATAEEKGRLKEQERAIEANNIAEAKRARAMEELRIEHEKNMQIMADENDKRREQEREIESKKLAEAELAMGQEKIRMNQEMIALAEKNGRLKEQEKAIEANNLAAQASLAIVKEELRMEHKKNMQIMEENEKRREHERMIESKNLAEAMRQEKIRMDQEMIAFAKKYDEKLREQEKMIESKNRVDAEHAEKLRMEQEMIALVEASKKRIEQQTAIESKDRAEAELLVKQEKSRMKKEKLQVDKEKLEQFIAQEVEKRLKEKQMNEREKMGIVYARDLSISWSDNISYWSWLPLPYEASSGSLVEAAVLKQVCWLSVNGKFNTIELTPATKYEVVYVVKLEDSSYGWKTPVNLKLTLPDSRARPQEHSVSLKEHIGKQWVDIPAGEFIMSAENTGEISFSLYETDNDSWKRGLFVKGVEIRPKK